MHPNLSCHPQEYKHALSMQCHTCIIHASTHMHYPCIHIRLVIHKSTHALLSMHSYSCNTIRALSFILSFTRSQARHNIYLVIHKNIPATFVTHLVTHKITNIGLSQHMPKSKGHIYITTSCFKHQVMHLIASKACL